MLYFSNIYKKVTGVLENARKDKYEIIYQWLIKMSYTKYVLYEIVTK